MNEITLQPVALYWNLCKCSSGPERQPLSSSYSSSRYWARFTLECFDRRIYVHVYTWWLWSLPLRDVAQLVEHWTARHSRRFDSPVWQGIFLPKSTFSADSLMVSVHPHVQLNTFSTCAHVKDCVVYVGSWWIMETLKQPACIIGWIVQLCCIWLSPRKATQISHRRSPSGTVQL